MTVSQKSKLFLGLGVLLVVGALAIAATSHARAATPTVGRCRCLRRHGATRFLAGDRGAGAGRDLTAATRGLTPCLPEVAVVTSVAAHAGKRG